MVMHAELNPAAFYDADGLAAVLDISKAKLSRAVTSGELRCTIRGGKKWFRGQRVIDWLDGKNEEPTSETEDER